MINLSSRTSHNIYISYKRCKSSQTGVSPLTGSVCVLIIELFAFLYFLVGSPVDKHFSGVLAWCSWRPRCGSVTTVCGTTNSLSAYYHFLLHTGKFVFLYIICVLQLHVNICILLVLFIWILYFPPEKPVTS